MNKSIILCVDDEATVLTALELSSVTRLKVTIQ